MIEFGHYQELSWILERINDVKGAEFGGRQTFVFSATLTLPRRSVENRVKVRRRKNLSSQESIGRTSEVFPPSPLTFELSPLQKISSHELV